MDISFDDLLPSPPAKKTSVKIKPEEKAIKAGRPYRPKELRETPAQWDKPTPESIILFWTVTTCHCCGSVYEAPTYTENSTLIRYRVSRFRTILRPYSVGLELFYRDLPRLKETTQTTVRFCSKCFSEDAELMDTFVDKLIASPAGQFVGPPVSPINQSCSEAHKPFVEVDYTDTELHTKQRT